MRREGGGVDLGGGVLLAAGAQVRLEGGRSLAGTPSLPRGHVRPPSHRCPTTVPARELLRPPRLRESLHPLEPWATNSRDPWRVPVASAHFLMKRFNRFLFFFAFMGFSPSPKKVIIQILLKMLFALKLPLYSFLLVRKGSLRTIQSGKYSVFSHCYLLFSIFFFFKHNYQKEELLRLILPIKTNRKKQKQNLKTGFVHLKDTHRIFVPCLTGSRQKQHLFEVLIWALAFSH